MTAPDWLNLAVQADQLLIQGRPDEAAEFARRSLTINPGAAVAHTVLGMIAWQRGEGIAGIRSRPGSQAGSPARSL
jgi:hypothetical protein